MILKWILILIVKWILILIVVGIVNVKISWFWYFMFIFWFKSELVCIGFGKFYGDVEFIDAIDGFYMVGWGRLVIIKF